MFKGRAVSYKPHFFTTIYGTSTSHLGHELKRKKQGAVFNLQYGPRKQGP